MQYCIYLRKSRADSEKENATDQEILERHEHTLLELAKRKKLNITAIYREVVSGETIAARPVMQQLLNEVEKGIWTGVLVMEVERLARGDTIDQGIMAQTFKLSDTKIITPLKTYDPNNEFDEEYFEFGLFMSRREYKIINRRLQRGRIASIEEGKFVGNLPPYGYKRKKLEGQKGYTLEIIPEQAEVVKLIFDLFVNGIEQEDVSFAHIGTTLIARKLNSLKIPSKNNKTWLGASVRDTLTNITYTGKISWGKRPSIKKMNNGILNKSRPRKKEYMITEGLHEAIISEEIWNKAQQILNSNSVSPLRPNKALQNPLSGLVICGKCGRKMQRRPHTAGKHPDTLYCPPIDCNNVSCDLAVVEKAIIKSLEDWLKQYKLKWTNKIPSTKTNIINIKKQGLKKIDNEINKLKTQFENLHDLLEQGVYDIEKFLERSKILTERINQAEAEKEDLKNEIELEDKKKKNQKDIIPKVENILESYKKAKTPLQKNNLLKEVLDKVVYTKEVNGRWHNRPDDFEIVLYPKISDDK